MPRMTSTSVTNWHGAVLLGPQKRYRGNWVCFPALALAKCLILISDRNYLAQSLVTYCQMQSRLLNALTLLPSCPDATVVRVNPEYHLCTYPVHNTCCHTFTQLSETCPACSSKLVYAMQLTVVQTQGKRLGNQQEVKNFGLGLDFRKVNLQIFRRTYVCHLMFISLAPVHCPGYISLRVQEITKNNCPLARCMWFHCIWPLCQVQQLSISNKVMHFMKLLFNLFLVFLLCIK